MELNKICKQVVALSRETGLYLYRESKNLDQSKVQIKGQNNFVTYVDKESEKKLIKGLTRILPQAGFLTEEGLIERNDAPYCWVIDPLDGTTNYIHHLSPYAISIGLMKRNEILLGVIHEVTLNETFYACQGGNAWFNGQLIGVSTTSHIQNGIIGYGIPYKIEPSYEYLRSRISSFYGVCTLRHLGSAAAQLCYVAAGRLDAYFHDNLFPWDVVAGAIIVKEAGGMITDLSGGYHYVFGKEIVASNGFIHMELLEKFRK